MANIIEFSQYNYYYNNTQVIIFIRIYIILLLFKFYIKLLYFIRLKSHLSTSFLADMSCEE